MGSSGKVFAIMLVVVFLTSTVSLSTKTGWATVNSQASCFPLPNSNATIILSNNASYIQATYYPAHNSTTTGIYVTETWDFGYSLDHLSISAENSNITITAFDIYTQNNTENYLYKTYSWLNYTVKGVGNQTLDYDHLYNSNNSNPIVYIDGIARQQGNGWNWANFGITVNGASLTVSFYQESTAYEPPRNPPHLSPSDYLPTSVIVIAVSLILIAIAALFRKRSKNVKKL